MKDNRKYRKGPNNRISQVRLSDALQSRLKDIAERDDRSLSYIIREACEEYVVRDDIKEFALSDSLDSHKTATNPKRPDGETSSS